AERAGFPSAEHPDGVLGPQVPAHPPLDTSNALVAIEDPPGAAPQHRVPADLVSVDQAVHAVAGPHHLRDRVRRDAGARDAGGPELAARVAGDQRGVAGGAAVVAPLPNLLTLVCGHAVSSRSRIG